MQSTKYQQDNITLWGLFKKPFFVIRLIFLAVCTLVVLGVSMGNQWPEYCKIHAWAHFNNLGTLYSLMIMEMAALATWFIFENANWVFYLLVYLIHSLILLLSACIYYVEFRKKCWLKKTLSSECIKDALAEFAILIIALLYLALSICCILLRLKFTE